MLEVGLDLARTPILASDFSGADAPASADKAICRSAVIALVMVDPARAAPH